jgi:hypothetical protein
MYIMEEYQITISSRSAIWRKPEKKIAKLALIMAEEYP